MLRADLKLVKEVALHGRDEELPDPRASQAAHGVQAAVPGIEVPHHADPGGARRPNRKGYAFHALHFQAVGSQFLPKLPMLAFTKKVEVELAQAWQERIGVCPTLFQAAGVEEDRKSVV